MSTSSQPGPAAGRPGPLPGPLSGLLVVDFTRVLAGPFATMMLADQGARVVKVERPDGGDDSRTYGPFVDGRSTYFARVNRGKESIALDLKDPADLDVARALCARADAVVENYRPGVMQRLGLGYDAVRATNPSVVYCAVSGFGHTGPWSQRPAYDAVVQGMSGVMSITGSADGPPVKPGIPVSDLAAGLYAFGALSAALAGRARTGTGTFLDIALYDATVSLLEGAALAYLATGEDPQRIGNAHFSIAPFDTFRCADRDITICAANDSLFHALLDALGLRPLRHDPRFVTNAGRFAERAVLKAALEEALATRPAAEWLAVLEAAGVPCGPISTVAEALDSPQSRARGAVVEAEGLRVPGNPARSLAFPDPGVRRAEPGLDEHGAAVRAWLAGTAP